LCEEFPVGCCEDIVRLRYQKYVLPCGLPLSPRSQFLKKSLNLVNFCWAVANISRVYCPKNLLGIGNKNLKKAGKIIECIAIGLRHLSVCRPKNAVDEKH